MIKKIFPFISVMLLIAVILLGFLFFKKQETYKGIDPVVAVPINASSILFVENAEALANKLNTNKKIWNEFVSLSFVSNYNVFSEYLDKGIMALFPMARANKHRSVCVSTHLMGNRKIQMLFSIPLMSSAEENLIRKKVNNLFIESKLSERKYSDVYIYSFSFKDASISQINIAYINGLMLISKSSILLEESIRQIQSQYSLIDLSSFAKIKNTVGHNVDANIFINTTKIASNVSLLTNRSNTQILKKWRNIGSWMSLDMNINNSNVVFSGFHSNMKADLFSVCAKQSAINLSIDEVVPFNTQLLMSVGVSDCEVFKQDYLSYLHSVKLDAGYNKYINKCKLDYGVDVEKFMYNLKFRELSFAVTGQSDNDKFFVVKTSGNKLAVEGVTKFVDTYTKKLKKEDNNFRREYILDENTRFDIYLLPGELSPSNIFGDMFSLSTSTCFTIIDEYIVFAKSKKELVKFINSKVLNNTLDKNRDFKLSKEYYSTNSNVMVYCNMSSYIYNFVKFFKTKISKKILDNYSIIKKLKTIGVQLNMEQDLMYNNVFFRYDSILNIEARKVWETKLDTLFKHKPIILPSHKYSQSISLIQDVNNKIYFINSEGKIISTKKISSKIVGDVHSIDFYNNGKIQYMFSTKDEIHCIDIECKDVSSYPLLLNYTTDIGISVFHYDSKNDYRIFVPSGKHIYVYTKYAKKVKGWAFKAASSKIRRKIQYFRSESKDYILFSDENKMYILNRQGKLRIRIKKSFKPSVNNIFYINHDIDKNKMCFRTSSQSGDIVSVFLNGDVMINKMPEIDKDHDFLPVDINNDGFNEYIYSYKKELKIYSSEYKLILDKKFKLAISYKPETYMIANRFLGIGVCLEKLNKSYLLDINGANIKSFPLNGNTPLAIIQSVADGNSLKILMGDQDNYVFSYNID